LSEFDAGYQLHYRSPSWVEVKFTNIVNDVETELKGYVQEYITEQLIQAPKDLEGKLFGAIFNGAGIFACLSLHLHRITFEKQIVTVYQDAYWNSGNKCVYVPPNRLLSLAGVGWASVSFIKCL
jgi:hypothetical protein